MGRGGGSEKYSKKKIYFFLGIQDLMGVPELRGNRLELLPLAEDYRETPHGTGIEGRRQ